MSEIKFTKGDWELSLDCGGKTLIHSNGETICEGILCSHYKKEVEPQRVEAMANAHLMAASPKMYEMLESVANELYMLIDEVNDQRASRITPQTECEPDYHDMQTIHEIQCLLAEARGVGIESS